MLLLSSYTKSGNIPKCEEVITNMLKSGIKLDTFVLNSMIHAYGKMGYFAKMEDVLRALESGPFKAHISTYNILISVYGRAGFLPQMEELFLSLGTKNLVPDVVTWTSRLGAYSKKKQYRKCLEIFEEMIDAGCHPDGGAAKVLLSSCSNEEQINQVKLVLRTMHKEVKSSLATV